MNKTIAQHYADMRLAEHIAAQQTGSFPGQYGQAELDRRDAALNGNKATPAGQVFQDGLGLLEGAELDRRDTTLRVDPGKLDLSGYAASPVQAGEPEDVVEYPPEGIGATLAERGSRYGSFTEHARITQAIKAAMADSPNWATLDADMREALEMLAHKAGRILNGDPHYHDIVGYTKLVADRLEP